MKTNKESLNGEKITTPLVREEMTLLRGKLIIGGTNLRYWLKEHGDVGNGYNALVGRRNGRRAEHIRSRAREFIQAN